MRGEPLHLCTADHPVILYTGDACPHCALRADLTAARRQIGELRAQVYRLEAARPSPVAKEP